MAIIYTLKPRIVSPAVHRQQEAKNVRRLGDPVSYDIIMNCLTCSRWPSCGDPKRAANYRCSRYREATMEETDLKALMADLGQWDEATDSNENLFESAAIDENDLNDLIETVLNTNIPVPPDLKINDKEIPVAKNFHEWSTSEVFGGTGGVPPFPRQLELGIKINSEWCPRCSDVEWFEEMPVDAPISEIEDRVVFLEHGKCPQCKATKPELILNKELLDPFSLVAICGQRSGKTASVVMWDSYTQHRVLKTPSPSAVYGLQDFQPLVTTFTALTFGQAVENLWSPYKNVLTNGGWFKNYHNFLDRRGHELGEELYVLSEHFARYRHRNIFISPASPSKRVMRGRTRHSSAVDEIGWFPLAKKGDRKNKAGGGGNEFERMDARGVRDALVNSLFTVKVAYRRRLEEGFIVPKPLFYAISSPQSTNDAIMTFYRESQGSKEIHTIKYPTWEYNPNIKRSDLDEYYRADPVAAARDFECQPPLGEGLFLSDHNALEKVFSTKKNNGIAVNTYIGMSKTKQKMTTSKVRILTNRPPTYPTILCVDVGIVNNSTSFSIIGLPENYDEDLEPEDRGTHLNPIQVFATGEIIPIDGTRISLTHFYRDCILPLVEFFNVAYFVSDRWQNIKLSQDLEDEYEVVPIEHKCAWVDFENTRELLYTGNVLLPRLDTPMSQIMETTLDNYPEVFRRNPVSHLMWQLLSVREQTKVTVLKGDGSTDDLFRTLVLGAAMMQDEEIFDYIKTNGEDLYVEAPPALGATSGYSKSGGGGGSGAGNSVLTPAGGNPVAAIFTRR